MKAFIQFLNKLLQKYIITKEEYRVPLVIIIIRVPHYWQPVNSTFIGNIVSHCILHVDK